MLAPSALMTLPFPRGRSSLTVCVQDIFGSSSRVKAFSLFSGPRQQLVSGFSVFTRWPRLLFSREDREKGLAEVSDLVHTASLPCPGFHHEEALSGLAFALSLSCEPLVQSLEKNPRVYKFHGYVLLLGVHVVHMRILAIRYGCR